VNEETYPFQQQQHQQKSHVRESHVREYLMSVLLFCSLMEQVSMHAAYSPLRVARLDKKIAKFGFGVLLATLWPTF